MADLDFPIVLQYNTLILQDEVYLLFKKNGLEEMMIDDYAVLKINMLMF